MNKLRRGFTLIELLVVVAIIGILASLSLANFRTAQVRAKVGQCVEDQRALSMAIDQLRIDSETMLVDLWDDDFPQGQGRIAYTFNGIGAPSADNPHSGKRSFASVLAPLTSPIMYLSHVPEDPFAAQPRRGQASSAELHDLDPAMPGNQTYLYADQDPQIPNSFGAGQSANYEYSHVFPGPQAAETIVPLRKGEYVLVGQGPSGKGPTGPLRGLLRVGLPYDPSNGTSSAGQIFRRSGGVD